MCGNWSNYWCCSILSLLICRLNTLRSKYPVIDNNSTTQTLHTSTQPISRSIYSISPLQHIENHNLRHLGTQTSIEDTSLRNSIGSIQQQLPDERAITTSVERQTSCSLPAYDDVAQRSSITITMEQQSLLPPSYDDFIRGN
ncbi:unnamed protein product [Rotaria sordida]|uniref:Uncharacterized protein n=1 Tax=Rotaria sordida TaxID=392033 RepID=A0A819N6K3_9BILA|nr:unnamed protein product [Rotaria sordida]